MVCTLDGTQRICSFVIIVVWVLSALGGAHAAAPGEKTLLLTAQTPAGGALLALDPLTGVRRPLALWPRADLADVSRGASGRIFVLDRGRRGAPARVLLVDPAAGTRRTLTSGGFLSDPRHAAELPGGDLLVIDRAAVGGSGALVRIDPAGDQHLVSFGRRFTQPSDLIVGAGGSVLILDSRPVLVDVVTGEQRAVSSSVAPFAQPLACDSQPGTGVFVCDGGALLHFDLERDRVTPLMRVPHCMRDLAVGAEGALFGAWSNAGEGGVLLVRSGGASVRVARGPELADVRGIALVPAVREPAGGFQDLDLAPPFHAPAAPTLPPVTIELRASTVTLLNGPGPADDEVRPAGPFPLATALRAARPGSAPVIGVIGEIPPPSSTGGSWCSPARASRTAVSRSASRARSRSTRASARRARSSSARACSRTPRSMRARSRARTRARVA
jgi:hypothetical protein